jgi:hypothetical protein
LGNQLGHALRARLNEESVMDEDRRSLLNAGAVAAGAAALLAAGGSGAAAPPAPQAPQGTGRAGEFDFLSGNWRIAHRRLKSPGQWDIFAGQATCQSILGATTCRWRQSVSYDAGAKWADNWIMDWTRA